MGSQSAPSVDGGFTQCPRPSLLGSSVGHPGERPWQVGNKELGHLPFPSHLGSPPVFLERSTLTHLIKEGMVLSLLLCVGRHQDCCRSTAGIICGFVKMMQKTAGGNNGGKQLFRFNGKCLPFRDAR